MKRRIWWQTLVILALKRLMKEDSKFEASLSYTVKLSEKKPRCRGVWEGGKRIKR
jgi:hypothetical protein